MKILTALFLLFYRLETALVFLLFLGSFVVAIKLEASRGDYTSLGGLSLFNAMMDELQLYSRLRDLLPGDEPRKRQRAFAKIRSIVLGFVAGADCLSDMDFLQDDLGFVAACSGKATNSRRSGDFLREFEPWQARRFNEILSDVALKIRRTMFKQDHRFILDIDSTIHEQFAQKMEGLGWAYNQKWGLSSLQAFDQYGFQHWIDVKGGSVHTADGVPFAIQTIFKRIPKRMERYLRADSGMCNFEVFRSCIDNRVGFCIAMRSNMYEPLIRRVKNWYSTKDVYFKDGRAAEIGTTIYYPRELGRERSPLRVVLIRAPKAQPELIGEFHLRHWDYHAWVTTIPESEMPAEGLVNFYKGRGNAENFIREGKNALDLHHFPCQELLANKMYGLFAAFAHNLMRMAAWTLDKITPRFSKKIRFRMVNLAGVVVKKSRYWIIRLSKPRHEEVTYWISTIRQQFSTG